MYAKNKNERNSENKKYNEKKNLDIRSKFVVACDNHTLFYLFEWHLGHHTIVTLKYDGNDSCQIFTNLYQFLIEPDITYFTNRDENFLIRFILQLNSSISMKY